MLDRKQGSRFNFCLRWRRLGQSAVSGVAIPQRGHLRDRTVKGKKVIMDYNNSILSNWVQNFADQTFPIIANPSAKDIWQSITKYLPDESALIPAESNASELLEQVLGINVIVEYGKEKIGWTATSDPKQAAKKRQICSHKSYSQARHALGIDGLWIFLPELEFTDHYQDEDLYGKAPEPLEIYEKFPEMMHLEERKECIIVEL